MIDSEKTSPLAAEAPGANPSRAEGKLAGTRLLSKRNIKVRPAKSSPKRSVKTATAQRGSKKARILTLLRRPRGASLDQLQRATGWQAHSVRGFLSGELKKKMGLRVHSAKHSDGVRTYRLTSK